MNKYIACFLIVLMFVCHSTIGSAYGGSFMFGTDESIHRIQKIESTDYYLCYKTTMHFFVAGIYVEDNGYVLTQGNSLDRYWELSDEQIEEWQQNGVLPQPLPTYSLGLWTYLFGYSLWIILTPIIAFPMIKGAITKKSGDKRARELLEDPLYHEALNVLNTNGIKEAVEFLYSKGIPLESARSNIELLDQIW